MGATTGIQWTDATWNPIGGCSIKSPGCTNCYAQGLAGTRLAQLPLYAGTTSPSKAGPVFNGHLTRAADDAPVWTWPLRWRGSKNPRLGAGKPSMIFVGDMADLFHEDRPDADIDRVFAVMALCPHHIFQVLTKRADRMREYIGAAHDRATRAAFRLAHDVPARFDHNDDQNWTYGPARLKWPLPNVWLGISAEDQQRADERIPALLATPAAKRFISAEPLLGPISLRWMDGIDYNAELRAGRSVNEYDAARRLDWVIVGGESGPSARPMHPNWARSLRDQCAAAVPFFFKQWGNWHPDALLYTDTEGRCPPPNMNIGKKRSGRLLDGIEHNGFPA